MPITKVTVTKTWVDQNNLFGIRPQTIRLTLYRTTKSNLAHNAAVNSDESKGWVKVDEAEITVTNGDTLTHTFKNLLKYNTDNKLYYFKVEEDEVKGYTTTYDAAITTDSSTDLGVTNTLQTIEVIAAKHWDDNGYASGSNLHYNVAVTLGASNFTLPTSGYTLTKVIDKTEGNGVKFTGLPRYKSDGTPIVYTITEKAADADATAVTAEQITGAYHDAGTVTTTQFFVAENGNRYGYEGSCKLKTDDGGNLQFNIQNKLPVVSFTAHKVWDDENNRDYVRPSELSFTLTRGEDTQTPWTVTENAKASEWSVDFGKYPKYDYNNTAYSYSVTEGNITGYSQSGNVIVSTAQVDQIPNTDYTFTNKHEPTEQSLTVKKIWDDKNYQNIRPDDLSTIKVELYYQYTADNGTDVVKGKVENDTVAVNGIKAHITKKKNDYVYAPTLNVTGGGGHFTTTDTTTPTTTPHYESTYTFEHLPVYINLDGTATTAGTQSKAVTYYVVETFTVNGHVYKTTYSADNSTYADTASASTGTTLTNGSITTPANKTIYVKNTPVTRDILVTKDWDDNGYGVTSGTDKVSDLSKKLHYNTAIQLSSSSTDVGYKKTLVLSKEDSDAGKGVLFKDVPIYDKDGKVIQYKVTESKDTTTAAAAGNDLGTPGNTDTLIAVSDGEFTQLKGTGEYSYGYEGSAKKVNKTENERTYVTRYHITDTLPLTSVQANKHWLDQNNEFSLRPDKDR